MDAAVQNRALRNRDILTVAVPIMLSNITTPLIGVVDMAVLGQVNHPYLIGAVAIGAQIFTMVFWAFGFLRMGTTGFVAQADGSGDRVEVFAILLRALIIAFGCGVLLWLLQRPISQIAFYLIPGSVVVEDIAKVYFDIRIWSAPAALANYALLGWFIGQGRAGIALILQLLLNGMNILFDVWLVLWVKLGVIGVAYGTVMAEVLAALIGLSVAVYFIGGERLHGLFLRVRDIGALVRMMSMNADIMVRTLCLLLAFAFLTAQSAGIDDVTLAANAVLIGFLGLSAYFLDGFAYAAERFVGRAIGARSVEQYRQAVWLSSVWAFGISVLVSVVFYVFGPLIINQITVSPSVREMANVYLIWVVLAPVIGVACFQLDGIFIGATQTRDMRNMMVLSLGIYFLSWYLLAPVYGNHGLWGAFMIFFVARAVTLVWRLPMIERSIKE